MKKWIIGAMLLFVAHSAWAQNEFPTDKNSYVTIDGGGIRYLQPVVSGNWARGINFFNAVSERYLGMGVFGNANEAVRFYIAYGQEAPWNSLLGIHLLPSGNVGIGTLTPQAKLAVNGNILAKEVKVKTNISVPDYVFEPDYGLPTLAEVEAYVRVHKHLPEIPSAADIERDGLDLAEMNLLLLKKVEELTLHLIDREKAERLLKAELQATKQDVRELKNLIQERKLIQP